MFVFSQCVSWGVCHFYGQTIRLAVWACKWSAKFSGSKFRPGIAFTICVQISFIYRETEAKTLNWYQRWLWRKETRLEKQKNLYRHSAAPGNFPLKFLEKSSGVPLPVLSNCIFVNRSLRASSPIWASEASRAKTRERAAKPLVRSRETRFACPNRGACSQAM